MPLTSATTRLSCGCQAGMGGASEPHWHTRDEICSLGVKHRKDEAEAHLAALEALRDLAFDEVGLRRTSALRHRGPDHLIT